MKSAFLTGRIAPVPAPIAGDQKTFITDPWLPWFLAPRIDPKMHFLHAESPQLPHPYGAHRFSCFSQISEISDISGKFWKFRKFRENEFLTRRIAPCKKIGPPIAPCKKIGPPIALCKKIGPPTPLGPPASQSASKTASQPIRVSYA